MSSYRVVIQSRISSSRLPAKALLPINGIPSVVLCALRAANTGADIVVATSAEPADDLLVKALDNYGINYIRGPLDNVLARFDLATQDLPQDSFVVRMTADNVFPDGNFVEELYSAAIKNDMQYLGSSSPADGLPYGMGAEVFSVQALRECNRKAVSKYDKEHVTPWIKRNYGDNLFRPKLNSKNLGHLRCTLDTFADYLRLTKVFEGIDRPRNISWYDLCKKLASVSGQPEYGFPFNTKNSTLHSDITLGTVQLGINYGAANITGLPSEEEAVNIIQRSIEYGVRSIDCARAYGLAENRVGIALTKEFADRVNVITKLDPLNDLKLNESEKNIRNAVDASVFKSCRELRTQQLQTLLLHRWGHRYAHNEAIWDRLLELKSEGVINKLGASVYTPEEAVNALRDPDINHIQLPFNILDWRWKAAGVDCIVAERTDVVIHIRSALLQGILTAELSYWPRVEGFDTEQLINKLEKLVLLLDRQNRADLCFAYVRSQAWINSIVVGMETMAQLDENLRLFQKPPLTADECRIVEECLDGVPEELLNPSMWNKLS